MIFLIYTILVILQLYKGIATEVQDPCPHSIITSDRVADMCKSSSAIEETSDGGYKVDSVVLRIMTQQDDCICRVMIDNQKETVVVGIRKYDGLTESAPEEAQCGLAVDVNRIPNMSTGIVIAPIECLVNGTLRNTPLFQKSYLQFRSRIINGDFIRGFCIRIKRDINSDHSQVLRIDCDAAPMTTEQTTEKITTSDAPQSSPQTPVSETSTTNSPQTPVSETSTTNTSNIDSTTTGQEQTTYIVIGAGSGVALILLVVIVVICLRRKSTQKTGTNGYVDKSHQQEESDDKLPDNVLYVPAGEFDITGGKCSTADVDTARSSNKRLSMEGNYSTVDEDMPKTSKNRISMDGDYSTVELNEHLDTNCSYPENSELGQAKDKQKPTIKPKPKSSYIKSEENRSSDQNIRHITPLNGSDNVYAIVDKSSKNVPTANVRKGEGTCQSDQTYAVVDKARKRKSSKDETNKKKFEINSGNRV